MKKILIWRTLLIAAMLILCFYTKRTIAQTTAGWKELVVGLSSTDHTDITYLLPVINTIPGISYQGFCETHRCLLVLFDPSVYVEEQELVTVFAEHKLQLYPKANTTFRMIKAECIVASLPAADQE